MLSYVSAEKTGAYRAGGLTLFLAVAVILGALAFEHIGGYAPCPLCLMQRYAYYAGIPLLFLAMALTSEMPRVAALLFFIVALGFLANAGLGVYHSGVDGSSGRVRTRAERCRPCRRTPQICSSRPSRRSSCAVMRLLAIRGPFICGMERCDVDSRVRGRASCRLFSLFRYVPKVAIAQRLVFNSLQMLRRKASSVKRLRARASVFAL